MGAVSLSVSMFQPLICLALGGVPWSWGLSLCRWMVSFMENPIYKWMITKGSINMIFRGTPIYGNPHLGSTYPGFRSRVPFQVRSGSRGRPNTAPLPDDWWEYIIKYVFSTSQIHWLVNHEKPIAYRNVWVDHVKSYAVFLQL